MAIRIHDTLSRSIKPLAPREPGSPYRMYCCGPTVYAPAHIGNFRTFLIQDVLRRTLEMDGTEVRHVRNITDIDDKTIRRSQEDGTSLREFTAHWTRKFHDDCAALNLLPPHVEPSAIEHIPLQIAMVKKLIERGHAYAADDGSVYFKIHTCADYGKLSHLDPRTLRTQSTNSGGAANDADEYERESVSDFALWKARKPADGPNFWPSPWGEGRPGWHIECSAMSTHYLGETFDLHGGGIDLCFPHHENEIAQAECATGHTGFAAHWFHSMHLMVDGAKMSKSLKNLYTLDDLRTHGATPMAVRYALIAGHYRSQLNFKLESLKNAAAALAKIERAAEKLLARCGLSRGDFAPPTAPETTTAWGEFQPAWDALRDDLNVPDALGKLFSALPVATAAERSLEQVRADLSGLGNLLFALGLVLFTEKPADGTDGAIPPEVAALGERRWAAKKARDFAAADTLRAELEKLGWRSVDNKDGYTLAPLPAK
ncbi:MAG: cysteine--tRNA ligase [Puniceicoccales bacterium]|jgi:cysteinyl-tRNA synthetase|nr:cysteine--tRNA ligase [Puniceicoccales bacterium]